MQDRDRELNDREEDEFLEKLVAMFGPKVTEAAAKGFAWWEVRNDLREILDEKAEARVVELPKERRASARNGYNRFHDRVFARLKKFYPELPPENN